MVASMTGFGQSKKLKESFSISVEIRSVNHRFFDCHVRLPQQMVLIEEPIKKVIREFVSRGRIDCFITINGDNLIKRQLDVDWGLIDEYYQFITSLKERYQLGEEIGLRHIITNKELVSISESEVVNEELKVMIIETVKEAVCQLKEMRDMEGKQLEKDLREHLVILERDLEDVEAILPKVTKHYEERIYNKIKDMTKGIIDENRIVTEVAILSERADISEEITRLKSHVQQFQFILTENEPVGRKLDFLIQEMNREVNTIGSKSTDSDISKKVVQMKSGIEKMREQVQNIE